MQPSEYLISALILINVLQAWYWSRQLQVLVDKIMSRSYAEYVHAKKKGNETLQRVKLPSEDEKLEDETLGLLNGMFKPGL